MPESHCSIPVSGGDVAQLTATDPTAVRIAAMDLLARREHSRRELRQKLLKRFQNAELVETQLDRLAEENLQSDSRYASSFLRQRICRGYGPNRIRQEMRQRGICDTEIEIAISEECPDWDALAAELYHRKFDGLPPGDLREKARRSRFMHYRGFEMDQYRRLLELHKRD